MPIPTLPSMKIAILGTRGIPNRYGGFEQFAEYLAVGLHERGHDVAVYMPHFHPYPEKTFKGVNLHRIYSPENRLGAAANFLYDYLSLRDAVQRGYEIILECGYGTSAPSLFFGRLGKCKIVTNMDGLEWKRAKWSPPVQRLFQMLEALAVRGSHALVADNVGIQNYLRTQYGAASIYIPYGSEIVESPSSECLSGYSVTPHAYSLAIARLEPENNLEMILDGFCIANGEQPLLVVGDDRTPYGGFLRKRYERVSNIRFLGSIYQKEALDSLRHHARLYFHGHSVGGTNPSLLEAMGCGAFIAAHDNTFNRAVLEDQAIYFSNPEEVCEILRMDLTSKQSTFREGNMDRIRSTFAWPIIVDKYEQLFNQMKLQL